jgi:hypothetical protein
VGRKRNTVVLTRCNRKNTVFDIWFDTDQGRVRIRRSSAEILKAVLHYKSCPFKKDRFDFADNVD